MLQHVLPQESFPKADAEMFPVIFFYHTLFSVSVRNALQAMPKEYEIRNGIIQTYTYFVV